MPRALLLRIPPLAWGIKSCKAGLRQLGMTTCGIVLSCTYIRAGGMTVSPTAAGSTSSCRQGGSLASGLLKMPNLE
jgi:hypothetical protein